MIKVYVRCTHCNTGNEDYSESIRQRDVLTSEQRVHRMFYDIDRKQLGNMTITDFVKGRECKNCGKKELIEI